MSKLLYLLFFSPFLMLFMSGAPEQPQDQTSGLTIVRDDNPLISSPRTISLKGQDNFRRAYGIASGGNRFTRNRSPLSSAKQKLKTAENDSQKEEAVEEIRDLLGKHYDEFLTSNQEQIDALQQRIDQLKEQLERRKKAKNRLVDLEVERMVNESEGLVWPNNQSRNRFFDRFDNSYEATSDPFANVPDFPGSYRQVPAAVPAVKAPPEPSQGRSSDRR